MERSIANKYFKKEVKVVVEGTDERKRSIFVLPLDFAMLLNTGDVLMFNEDMDSPLQKWLLKVTENYEELLGSCVKITERNFLYESVLFYADYV